MIQGELFASSRYRICLFFKINSCPLFQRINYWRARSSTQKTQKNLEKAKKLRVSSRLPLLRRKHAAPAYLFRIRNSDDCIIAIDAFLPLCRSRPCVTSCRRRFSESHTPFQLKFRAGHLQSCIYLSLWYRDMTHFLDDNFDFPNTLGNSCANSLRRILR